MTHAPVYRLSPDSDGLRLRIVRIRAQKEGRRMNVGVPCDSCMREAAQDAAPRIEKIFFDQPCAVSSGKVFFHSSKPPSML